MAKRKPNPQESDSDRQSFFNLVQSLWKDGSKVRQAREKLDITQAEAAKRAGISTAKVSAYERPGQLSGNFWLFCGHLRSYFVDPRLINDPDYLEGLLEPDPDDHLKGGSEMDRDKWYEFDRSEHEVFRRWVHRKKLKKLPKEQRRKKLTRRQIQKWHDEWVKAGRPDVKEIVED